MEDIIIAIIIQAIVFLYPVWRIYQRAGINPGLSLTVIIPKLGLIVCALILVFSKWHVKQQGGK